MTFPLGTKVHWLLCCCVVLHLWIQDLNCYLLFQVTTELIEVHGNIKQQAIALTNSESSKEASDKQAAGPSASGSGPAFKKRKYHDETWSVILGLMF